LIHFYKRKMVAYNVSTVSADLRREKQFRIL